MQQFSRSGECRYGENCKFAHIKGGSGDSSSNSKTSNKQSPAKSAGCWCCGSLVHQRAQCPKYKQQASASVVAAQPVDNYAAFNMVPESHYVLSVQADAPEPSVDDADSDDDLPEMCDSDSSDDESDDEDYGAGYFSDEDLPDLYSGSGDSSDEGDSPDEDVPDTLAHRVAVDYILDQLRGSVVPFDERLAYAFVLGRFGTVRTNDWYLDSGCTHHIAYSGDALVPRTLRPCPSLSFTVANDQSVVSNRIGSVSVL
jgi:hypothetical protein